MKMSIGGKAREQSKSFYELSDDFSDTFCVIRNKKEKICE